MSAKLDSVEALRVFVRVAEAGSFRAAANSLQMPKSTVSAMVQRLEQQLETLLLHRTTRSVRLTIAGERLMERSQAIFDALEAAEMAVAPRQGEAQGRLVVSAPGALTREFLASRLPRFMNANPRVNVVLRVQSQTVDLIADGVDVVIHVGPPPTGDVRVLRVGEVRGGLTASADYVEARGLPKRPEDLRQHDLISVAHERSIAWQLLSGKDRVDVRHQPRFSCSELGVTTEAIRQGVGIGWMPDIARRSGLLDKSLVAVLPNWRLLSAMEIWLVYLERRQHSAALAAFIDFMRAEVATLTHLLTQRLDLNEQVGTG